MKFVFVLLINLLFAIYIHRFIICFQFKFLSFYKYCIRHNLITSTCFINCYCIIDYNNHHHKQRFVINFSSNFVFSLTLMFALYRRHSMIYFCFRYFFLMFRFLSIHLYEYCIFLFVFC